MAAIGWFALLTLSCTVTSAAVIVLAAMQKIGERPAGITLFAAVAACSVIGYSVRHHGGDATVAGAATVGGVVGALAAMWVVDRLVVGGTRQVAPWAYGRRPAPAIIVGTVVAVTLVVTAGAWLVDYCYPLTPPAPI